MNEFDYSIEYVAGKSNLVADALSRLATSGYMMEGENLELCVPRVLHTGQECGLCDDEFDWCDKCGE